MSDLLERLRALRGGDAPEVPASPPPDAPPAEVAAAALGGEVVEGASGPVVRRRVRRPLGERYGDATLGDGRLHPWLRRWASRGGGGTPPAGDEGSGATAASRGGAGRTVYFDTETTGLAGGVGTRAFLIGLGWHEGDAFVVEQLFLPGPAHEPAWLDLLAPHLEGAEAWVSYNGGSFDVPLVRTRFAVHGRSDPSVGRLHLDLLPLARRWWRASLAACTLGTVEREVLGAVRTDADVPGAEVPARYRRFVQGGDAVGLRGVMTHNELDVVALAAVHARLEASFAAGPSAPAAGERPPFDVAEALGVARWLEAIGEREEARAHYAAWAEASPEAAFDAGRLARRAGDRAAAVAAWTRAAEAGHAPAWVELAKVREHAERDPEGALAAVAAARAAGGDPRDDLDRREARLRAKRARGRS
mgnify:CR=1 FL=1